MAGLLAWRGDYRLAFAALVIPAAATLLLLGIARLLYPRPEDLEPSKDAADVGRFPRRFWVYLAGAALVGAGFADFPLIAYHFQKSGVVSGGWIPVFYAIAMGVGGAGSLLFGKLFDRRGILVLVPLTVVSAAYAPLAFLGHRWACLAGAAVWGIGMGVHESLIAAVVATMVGTARRASAYGLFTAAFGIAWFVGSALLGWLYDVSPTALVVVAVALELAAIPFFFAVARRTSNR